MTNPAIDTPRLKLWGIGTGRTLRPIWTAFELGLERDVDFALEEILTRTPMMETPEYRAVSPRGKIPMLDDGDLRIGESAAISLYLADCFRGRVELVPPAGTADRARHDELCWFAMTEMDALLYVVRRHGGLPEIYGASEVAVQSALEYFVRSREEIERRFADDRPYLLGDTFSVADLVVKSCVDWAAALYELPVPQSLAAWSKRVAERPAFGQAMKTNYTAKAMAAIRGEYTE